MNTKYIMKKLETYTVYGHCNLTTDKWYIGCTKQNPSYRWNGGKGYNNQPKMWKDIQESNWNNDWIHTIFDTFYNKEDALDYESFLIEMFDAIENGYNTSTYGNSHFKCSDESKKKISESKIGKKNPMFGKHLSEETRKKLSEANTGENNPFYGKHFSEESKKKIRENNPSKQVLQFSKDGEFIAEYPSTREAGRKIGCNPSNICACCKGKLKSANGYIWKYKEAS